MCTNTLRIGPKRRGDPMDEASRQSSSSSKIRFHQSQVGGITVLNPLPAHSV